MQNVSLKIQIFNPEIGSGHTQEGRQGSKQTLNEEQAKGKVQEAIWKFKHEEINTEEKKNPTRNPKMTGTLDYEKNKAIRDVVKEQLEIYSIYSEEPDN